MSTSNSKTNICRT